MTEKLLRITIGGIDQLSSFSGRKKDYIYLGITKVESKKEGDKFVIYGALESPQERKTLYNPNDRDSFLLAVDYFLDEQQLFITHANFKHTFFKRRFKLEGKVYIKKEDLSFLDK